MLRARVGAPAVEGAANNALIRLIADELGDRQARRPDRGRGDVRQKLLVIEGADPEAIVARWPGLKI